MRLRLRATFLLAAALLAVPSPAVAATPEPIDPTVAVTWPVHDLAGEVQPLTFPEATLDGSVVDEGNAITLLSDVFFDYNSHDLNAAAREALDRVAATLRERDMLDLVVSGHTDSDGADAANQALSERRADAVAAALRERIPGVSIRTEGHGESRPVATNETLEGRALNRRVVISVAF